MNVAEANRRWIITVVWLAVALSLLCNTVGGTTISYNTSWSESDYVLGALTVTNGSTLSIAAGSNLTVNGLLWVTDQSTLVVMGNASANKTVSITAVNLTVDADSRVSADGQGYMNASGPGAGNSTSSSYSGGGGGGYGGAGGTGYYNILGGGTYGSSIVPRDFGSGGGDYAYYYYPYHGGYGGGVVKIKVIDTFQLDGVVSSNGGDGGSTGYYRSSGGGSGGSIYLLAGVINGSGNFTAYGGRGGNSSSAYCGGGGGGGRIAVYYQHSNLASFNTSTAALGGSSGCYGSYASYSTPYGSTGDNGTVVFEVNSPPNLSQDIPDVTWTWDTNYTLDLGDYFTDLNGDTLHYSYTPVDNITVSISEDGTATLIPDQGFLGSRTIYFTANDTWNNLVYSNPVSLTLDYINLTQDLDPVKSALNEGVSVYGNAIFSDSTPVVDNEIRIYVDGVLQPTVTPQGAYGWWNNNWTYRLPIAIVEQSGSNLSDFQANITLNTLSLVTEGKLDIDCRDIRVINSSGSQIPYWIENACNTSDTRVWTKVPYLAANGNETIYVYYGNSHIVDSESSFDDVFTKDFDANDTSLLLKLHMDEGSGLTAYDASLYGNNGSLQNGPVWQDTDGGQWDGRSDVNFQTGSAIVFDGYDDYVGLTNPLPIFNKSFTVSMWVKVPSTASGRVGVLLGDYGLGGINVNVEIHSGGQIRFYWGGSPDLYGSIDLRDDSWHLITFVRDKENNKTYGYIDTTVDINYTVAISDKTAVVQHYIGRDSRTGDTAFEGFIDEVRIYDRPLSASEIRAHYGRRRYVELEPEVALGGEQVISRTDSDGLYSYSFTAPYIAGIYNVTVAIEYEHVHASVTRQLTVNGGLRIEDYVTAPEYPIFNESVNLLANVTDEDDNLVGVYFTVWDPAGSPLIDNVSGVYNVSDDLWYSPDSFRLSENGFYNYSIRVVDEDGWSATVNDLVRWINVNLNIQPNITATGTTVTAYGDLSWSNGVQLSDQHFLLWVNESVIDPTSSWAYTDPWMDGEWMYRRVINVTYSGLEDLTDYAVEVSLDTSTIDYSQVESNGSDIRFADDSGNHLSYWIKSWNTTGESTIWVKLRHMPANSSAVVYLYYGNPDVSSGSNGTATFTLFGDFSGGGYSEWTPHLENGGSIEVTPNGRLFINASSGWTGLFSDIPSEDDFEAEWRTELVYRDYITFALAADPYNINYYGRPYNGYYFEINIDYYSYASQMLMEQGIEGYSYDLPGNPGSVVLPFDISENESVTYRLQRINSTIRVYANDTLLIETNDSFYATSPLKFGFGNKYYSRGYTDYVLVRKISDTEPTTEVGAEQVNMRADSDGVFNYSFNTPSVNETVMVRINLTADNIYREYTTQLTLQHSPVFGGVYSLPGQPVFNDSVTLLANVTDDNLVGVYFTVWGPSDSIVLDNVSGVYNVSDDLWYSPDSFRLSENGFYNYSIRVVDEDGWSATVNDLVRWINVNLNIQPNQTNISSTIQAYGQINWSNGAPISYAPFNIYLGGNRVSWNTSTAGWWNNSWSKRVNLELSNTGPYTLGSTHTVSYVFDVSSTVADGDLRTDRNDLRLLYFGDNNWTELNRLVYNLNETHVEVVFRLKSNLSSDSTQRNYFIYYGNPAAGQPPERKDIVYWFWDNFNDGSLNNQSMWTITETMPGNITVTEENGSLKFSATSFTYTDVAETSLASKSSYYGNITLEYRVKWSYGSSIPQESYYLWCGGLSESGLNNSMVECYNAQRDFKSLSTKGYIAATIKRGNVVVANSSDHDLDDRDLQEWRWYKIVYSGGAVDYYRSTDESRGTYQFVGSQSSDLPSEPYHVYLLWTSRQTGAWAEFDEVMTYRHTSTYLTVSTRDEEEIFRTDSTGSYNRSITAPPLGGAYNITVNLTHFNLTAGSTKELSVLFSPVFGGVYSLPRQPVFNDSVTLLANVTDDNLLGVYFTVWSPLGSVVLDNVSGSLAEGVWTSPSFTLNETGFYNYSVYAVDADGWTSSYHAILKWITVSLDVEPNVTLVGGNVSLSGQVNWSDGSPVTSQVLNIYIGATPVYWNGNVAGWWNSSWKKRRLMRVENKVGYSLYNYSLRINFTNTLYNKADFSDLRFLYLDDSSSTQELLSYWLENYTINSSAIFWVKVPYLPAGSASNVYVYYNNSNAMSNSNASQAFLFFDDFNNLSLWRESGYDYYIYSSEVDNRSIVNMTYYYGLISTVERMTLPTNAAIERMARSMLESNDSYTRVRESYGLLCCAPWSYPPEYYNSNITYHRRYSDYTPSHAVCNQFNGNESCSYGSEKLSTDWAISQLIIRNDSIQGTYGGENLSLTTTNALRSGYLFQYSYMYSYYNALYVDWIRVREHVDVEPSTAFSDEESLTETDSTGGYNYSIQPQASDSYTVTVNLTVDGFTGQAAANLIVYAFHSSGNATLKYTPEEGRMQDWLKAEYDATTPAGTSINLSYSNDNETWYHDLAEVPDSESLYLCINLLTTDVYVTPKLHNLAIQYSSTSGYWAGVFDSGETNASWGALDWSESKPEGTTLMIRLRTAPTRDTLNTASWSGWRDSATSVDSVDRWIEVQARLTTDDTRLTPTLYNLRLNYSVNTSTWVDEAVILNDTGPRDIKIGSAMQLKLDTLWNESGGWDTSTFGHGNGTYRVYIAATDENDVILYDSRGNEVVATYEFDLGYVPARPNKVPSLGGLYCDGDVTLLENSTKPVTCWVIVNDDDGCSDVNASASSASIWHNTVTEDSLYSNLTHYLSSNCSLECTGTYTGRLSCMFDVAYYATSGLWNASMSVADKEATIKNYSTEWINVEELTAVSILGGIGGKVDFRGSQSYLLRGTESSEVEYSIHNTGNTGITLLLSGTNMTLVSGDYNISVGSIRYSNISGQEYSLMCPLNESMSACDSMDFTLPKSTDGTPPNAHIYWRMQIPADAELGVYNGTIDMVAVSS